MLEIGYENPVGANEKLKNPQEFKIRLKGVGTITASRRTYQKIVDSNYIDTINPVLKTLSDSDQEILFNYYAQMLTYIRSITPDSVVDIINTMESYTTTTLNSINLIGKIDRYVNTTNIPYPDLSLIGTRERDSEEMSFYLPEYKQLTGICILCKLMGPIWGALIAYLQKESKNPELAITNTENREPFCLQLIIELLETSIYADVYNKLTNYMVTMINRYVDFNNSNNNTSFVMANSGMSDERYYNITIATVIVKKLVPFNIWKGTVDNYTGNLNPPDIMRHIASATKDNGENKFKNLHTNSSLMVRFPIDTADDDDDNTSQLENVSVASQHPFDVGIITSVGFKNDVLRFIADNGYSMELFTNCCEFYYRKSLDSSEFSKSMMASILVRYLESPSVTLHYLNFKEYIQLTVLTQLIMLSHGDTFIQLFPFISCKSLEKPLREIQPIDQRVLSTRQKDNSCSSIFRNSVIQTNLEHTNNIHTGKVRKVREESSTIKTQINKLVEWVVLNHHTYLVPPALWEHSKITDHPSNDTPLLTYDMVITDIYSFFSTVHRYDKQIDVTM